MATFKDFAVNEVLTSADVDTYLMRNAVIPCASATDRDADLAGFQHEGMYADTADNNMLWRYDGTKWMEARPWLVVKAADEFVTNTTTMNSDDELLFPAQANAIYIVTVMLDITVGGSSSGSDFKLGWSLPASASFSGYLIGPDVALTAASAVGSADWTGITGGSGATYTRGLFSTGTTGMVGHFTVTTAGTSGNVTLQWSQAVATAVNTTVKAKSYLKAERVS